MVPCNGSSEGQILDAICVSRSRCHGDRQKKLKNEDWIILIPRNKDFFISLFFFFSSLFRITPQKTVASFLYTYILYINLAKVSKGGTLCSLYIYIYKYKWTAALYMRHIWTFVKNKWGSRIVWNIKYNEIWKCFKDYDELESVLRCRLKEARH